MRAMQNGKREALLCTNNTSSTTPAHPTHLPLSTDPEKKNLHNYKAALLFAQICLAANGTDRLVKSLHTSACAHPQIDAYQHSALLI